MADLSILTAKLDAAHCERSFEERLCKICFAVINMEFCSCNCRYDSLEQRPPNSTIVRTWGVRHVLIDEREE